MKKLALKRSAKLLAVAALIAPLAACGGANSWLGGPKEKFSAKKYGVSASPRITKSSKVKKGGGRYQVGKAYKVAGKWYHPKVQPNYNKVGIASWYGPNFHGRMTANGEVFDQNALSAAHPTLPLPSYVRVTNLANGISTLVRVNDRGPFSNGRIIDLSSRTADILQMKQKGTAKVRVQYVGKAPLEGDDTRFLVASINNKTDMELGGARVAYTSIKPPTPPERDPFANAGPQSDDTVDLLTYSYAANANSEAAFVNDAHFATEQMASGVSAIKFATPKPVGTYNSLEAAHEVARQFALLAIVNIQPVEIDGDTKNQVVIEGLRDGVTKDDVNNIAYSLGVTDFVL